MTDYSFDNLVKQALLSKLAAGANPSFVNPTKVPSNISISGKLQKPMNYNTRLAIAEAMTKKVK